MIQKSNSFGKLLQTRIREYGIKNSAVAVALQYDVSYLSKWISGKMLPSEKNISRICSVTAEVLTNHDAEREIPESDLVAVRNQLRDELYEAYLSDRNHSDPAPLIKFHTEYPLTDMVRFLLDQVHDREACCAAVADLLSMEHDARLLAAGICNGHFLFSSQQKQLHYDLILDLSKTREAAPQNRIYDTIYLIHMLTSFSSLDFRVFHWPAAAGKFLFSAEDICFACGTVTAGEKNSTAVTLGRECDTARDLYRHLSSRAVQEAQVFRPTEMDAMIGSQEYISSMISTRICWLLGHITEHLLPEDVFEDLLCSTAPEKLPCEAAELRKIHFLSKNVYEIPGSRIVIYETAVSNFIVTGEADFFNTKKILSPRQRIRVMQHLIKILKNKHHCEIRMIEGGLSPDFRYITNPCMFLSDTVGYLRLENGRYSDNLLILQNPVANSLFRQFFHDIWTVREDVILSEPRILLEKMEHYLSALNLLSSADQSPGP